MIKRILPIIFREVRANVNYRLVKKLAAKSSTRASSRVGIVRLDLIGDFVLFTAVLREYRSAFPDATLVLFGNEAWRDLAEWINRRRVVSQKHPLFDEFVGIEPERLTSLSYFRDAVSKLRAVDVVINTAYSRTNIVDKVIAASGVESIGATGDATNSFAFQKRANDGLYARLIPNSDSTTEWERNSDFVQALAPETPLPRTPPSWRLTRELADAELGRWASVVDAAPFIAVSPFTSLTIKQWPLDRYRDLLRRILERVRKGDDDTTPTCDTNCGAGFQPACGADFQPACGADFQPAVTFPYTLLESHRNLHLVILGSKDKTHEAESLVQTIPDASRVINLVGKTTLVEAACVLYRAVLSISGDTAAAHIASAVGTPSVAIMGGGHYGRFFPYPAGHSTASNHAITHPMECFHCNWVCKYRRFSNQEPPCLVEITVGEVFDRVAALLLEK